MSDGCPHKEDSLDNEEWKGTCELDGGDCTFPLNPKEWRNCERLHQDVCPINRIADAHQQFRSEVLEEVYKRLEKMATLYHYEIVVPWSDVDCLFAELRGKP